MKPNETTTKISKRYLAIMLLCFLYGGFAIILFSMDLYSYLLRPELPAQRQLISQDINALTPGSGAPASGRDLDLNGAQFGRRGFSPMRFVESPFSLSFLASGIICIIAGLAIGNLTREKEHKGIRADTANSLLLPDEKLVVEALKKADYELTQSKLAKVSGLNKVQVHRAIKRLEAKGLIEKHDYGLTNKIMLRKGVL
ncbi:Uncharacterised protein [uncultured archaeon]|nr:Uncharacterised protein [uncultured archaeon]